MSYFQRLPEPIWGGPRRLRIPPGEWQPPEQVSDDAPLTPAERWKAHRLVGFLPRVRGVHLPIVEVMMFISIAFVAWCNLNALFIGVYLGLAVFIPSFAKVLHRRSRASRRDAALDEPLPGEDETP